MRMGYRGHTGSGWTTMEQRISAREPVLRWYFDFPMQGGYNRDCENEQIFIL